METITMYTTSGVPIVTAPNLFMKDSGVQFQEVDIEEDPAAQEIVIKANHGKRKVPTLKIGDRYFACSPFNPAQLAAELNVPLNK